MFVIGLTGSLATGKSTVAACFKRCGARVISADELAHQAIKPGTSGYRRIIKEFGQGICAGSRIDRRKLAAIVFKQPAKLKKLEGIIHPSVIRTIKSELRLARRSRQWVVLEVPLLFEAGLNKCADVTGVVASTQAHQLQRARAHYAMSTADALRRIKAQMPLQKKIRLADFIIDNNGTKKQTEKQVKSLCQKLQQKKKK